MKLKFKIGNYIINKNHIKSNERIWQVVNVGKSGYMIKSIMHPTDYFKSGQLYLFSTEFTEPKYILIDDIIDLVTVVL